MIELKTHTKYRLIITIMILAIAITLSACKNSIEEINILTYRDTFPAESAHDVKMIYSDSARIKAMLKSPIVNSYSGEDSYIVFPKGLTVFFFDSAMQVKTSLTARYAIKYEKSDIMEARNDVVVVNQIGERLNTEHLVWDQNRKLIYTKVFVKITKKDEVVYGDGMEADESFDKWTIKKPKGEFFINTDENKTEDTESD